MALAENKKVREMKEPCGSAKFVEETMEFTPFEKKVWLATPTMHGEELKYMIEAYETNWMSTVGANINEVERIAAEKAEMKYAVALSSCTAALHLCVKSAGERLYGNPLLAMAHWKASA